MTFNRIVFRLHWLAGITAGLVLAVVGATGGLLGMQAPVQSWLNPQRAISPPAGVQPLSPDALVANARRAYPGLAPISWRWQGDDRAVSVQLRGRNRRERQEVLLDPYTGQRLADVRGDDFFHAVEDLHRHLAAGAVGKQLVGASTALLVLLAISGLIQRWPRRHTLRLWLKPEFTLRGRGLWRNLHTVLGTWVLAFYLVAALTGLWWSYGFYRDTVNHLAGVGETHRPRRGAIDPAMPVPSIDKVWAGFRQHVPDATEASLSLATAPGRPLDVRYQTGESPHPRAWNSMKLDGATGAVLETEMYADQPRGRRFVSSLFPLHSGSFFGVPGRWLMALACLLMPFFTVTGLVLWYLRRKCAQDASRALSSIARKHSVEAVVASE